MTKPPARSAWMRLALSAAARLGIAAPSAPHRPENSASAARVRLDRVRIERVLQSDDWDISGAEPAAPVHCLRRVPSAKTANRSFLFPAEVRMVASSLISRGRASLLRTEPIALVAFRLVPTSALVKSR